MRDAAAHSRSIDAYLFLWLQEKLKKYQFLLNWEHTLRFVNTKRKINKNCVHDVSPGTGSVDVRGNQRSQRPTTRIRWKGDHFAGFCRYWCRLEYGECVFFLNIYLIIFYFIYNNYVLELDQQLSCRNMHIIFVLAYKLNTSTMLHY